MSWLSRRSPLEMEGPERESSPSPTRTVQDISSLISDHLNTIFSSNPFLVLWWIWVARAPSSSVPVPAYSHTAVGSLQPTPTMLCNISISASPHICPYRASI
eukprot:scaffold4394_cov113-Isochrysis_galbana.AAC.2